MKVGEIRGWLRVLPGSCANFPGIDWEDITLPEPSNPRNECEDGTHFCSDDSKCSDTLESYSCTCKCGFTGDGYTCNIIKECDDECSEHAYCDKIEEHFQCKCKPGFTGDGSTCSNLNECSEPQNVCSEFAKCTDTLGSFYCFCRLGYEGNGFVCKTSISCPSGSYLENGINCTLCPLNSYSNRDNNVLSNCIQCPPNYVTGVLGSTSVSQCFRKYEFPLLNKTNYLEILDFNGGYRHKAYCVSFCVQQYRLAVLQDILQMRHQGSVLSAKIVPINREHLRYTFLKSTSL